MGVVWLSLRVEAFRGGRGDRFIPGTPTWLHAMPVIAGAYLVRPRRRVWPRRRPPPEWRIDPGTAVIANALLVAIYMAIGWYVLRTQLANRPAMGGWSVSGLCLAAIFPTCALMHGVWAVYAVTGLYHHDHHGTVIDWLSVPAGIFFLIVVHGLYRDALSDWNDGPDEVSVGAADHGFEGPLPSAQRVDTSGNDRDQPIDVAPAAGRGRALGLSRERHRNAARTN